jgi:hypothetical protein
MNAKKENRQSQQMIRKSSSRILDLCKNCLFSLHYGLFVKNIARYAGYRNGFITLFIVYHEREKQ